VNKELEALSYLVETAIYGNKENNRGSIFEAENTIKQSLTPSTEEEVCNALSEYLGEKIYYQDNAFWFNNTRNLNAIIAILYKDNTIGFKMSLPPHLATIIGRFYEGVNTNE
jgi:hypothetical protein